MDDARNVIWNHKEFRFNDHHCNTVDILVSCLFFWSFARIHMICIFFFVVLFCRRESIPLYVWLASFSQGSNRQRRNPFFLFFFPFFKPFFFLYERQLCSRVPDHFVKYTHLYSGALRTSIRSTCVKWIRERSSRIFNDQRIANGDKKSV